jgi:hypothetical protein
MMSTAPVGRRWLRSMIHIQRRRSGQLRQGSGWTPGHPPSTPSRDSLLPRRCEPARTVVGAVSGLRAAEAASRTTALGGMVLGGETVEALAAKIFREAPARGAGLPEVPPTRPPAYHHAPLAIRLSRRKRAMANNRSQPPRLSHRGRSADHDIPIRGSRRRRWPPL